MTYDIYKLEHILEEMRQYNPKADEYGGKHIIPGWAERIERAIKDIKVESESRRQFILNGVEFGYIRLPDSNDPAFHVYQRCINEHEPRCERCNGSGFEDSGGVQPWGEQILVECECRLMERNIDESRKQFLEWLQPFWSRDTFIDDDGDQQFVDEWVQGAWVGWQASRAAIEIKLDDKVMVEDEFDKGHNCAIDYCAEAIRAAGIKVKE